MTIWYSVIQAHQLTHERGPELLQLQLAAQQTSTAEFLQCTSPLHNYMLQNTDWQCCITLLPQQSILNLTCSC